MRLISQDLRTDIPYEQFCLLVRFENGIGWVIAAIPCGADRQTRYHMAVYSKRELAILEAKQPVRVLQENANPFRFSGGPIPIQFYVFRTEEDVQATYDQMTADQGENKNGT